MARVSDTRDERQITLDNYSGDVWLCRDGAGNGWLVVADGICIASGQPTPDTAIGTAAAYVSEHGDRLVNEVAALRRRIG